MMNEDIKNKITNYEQKLTECFEREHYKKALQIAKKMYKFAPKNAYAVFMYATCLENVDNNQRAIVYYEKILKFKNSNIAKEVRFCRRENIDKATIARSFKNDCCFRIAECYEAIGKYNQANIYVKRYFRNLDKCISEFSLKYSNGFLKHLQRNIISKQNDDKIGKFLSERKWDQAVELLKMELKLYKDSSWLLTRLSLAYYEKGHYRKALGFSEKAYAIGPCEPLVLWDYGNVLSSLKKYEQAIHIYKKIVNMGVKGVATYAQGSGISWAQSLINDSRVRIGKCYYYMDNPGQAKQWFNKHLSNRKRGLCSDFTMQEVEQYLKVIENKI